MKPYLALVRVNLRLALRERIAIFFNYVFPLIFFFAFGGLLHAERGGVIAQIVTMVLVIGILGNGLFGGGIRAVQDREQNILRRFKVAPISPTPMLVGSIVTGWALYLPAVVMTLTLAHFYYGMRFPERWFSLLVIVSVGVVAFRAIGLIIASVANSAQESQVLIQLVYLPMLFLSGTTFSVTLLPVWAQTIAQFLPATYLVTALQDTIVRRVTLAHNWKPLLILLLTAAVSVFLSAVLFRWEKEEKLRASAKLALVAMVFPSLLLGAWQVHSRDALARSKALYHQIQRGQSLLIRGARIFPGDGRMIESGAVLVQAGKIAEVYTGHEPTGLKAEAIDAFGKTLLPGLIDVQVQLTSPGGIYPPGMFQPAAAAQRELAAYLYCGITAVRSLTDPPEIVLPLESSIVNGERLGAEVLTSRNTLAAYVPLLSVKAAAADLATGGSAALRGTLVEQVGPSDMIRATQAALASARLRSFADTGGFAKATEALLAAYRSGALLAAGSGAGAPLVFHGPSIQRELALWVKAGIAPRDALQAATGNAARLLGLDGRLGTIRKGNDADLLLVDGNPLEDIAALERISEVIFKGERIDRASLLDQH